MTRSEPHSGTRRNRGSILRRFDLQPLGNWGMAYLVRATVAWWAIGANFPEDALYPVGVVDDTGQRLDGANDYVLRFAEGQLPPVDGFWSLTMYDSQMFQVANPIDRFAIGDRDDLVVDDDGSVTLYIQHESPGPDKESNWLPSPESGPIIPILRLYGPSRRQLWDAGIHRPGSECDGVGERETNDAT